MVARGSGIAPSPTFSDALEARREAQLATASVEQDCIAVRGATSSVVAASDSASPAELRQLVLDLQRRVDELERHQRVASESQQKSFEMIKIASLQLVAGGIAGSFSRTGLCALSKLCRLTPILSLVVAPLDRLKILSQTRVGAGASASVGVFDGLINMYRTEGLLSMWRGNLVNVVRIAPYSALQFASYDFAKRILLQRDPSKSMDSKLSVWQRLSAGAFAGSIATAVTHPLDVIRLRLAVDSELKGSAHAVRSLLAENGARALFQGFVPSILSVAPYIALNFSLFDILKSTVYTSGAPTDFGVLGLGAIAGALAQTVCYPLDTVRRRLMMPTAAVQFNSSMVKAFSSIYTKEGTRAFFRGWSSNTLKIMPNNAIRFWAYEYLKRAFGVDHKSKP